MTAYYNEHDPFAAEWLRQLIKAGHIADGVVDERNIVDVQAEEVREFTQCHWFAGIGTWSYALRAAMWPDDRYVWTGSPPCQPFSAAGKQRGKDDERHLAPHWLELVTECGPPVVFGEQVEAAIRHGWFDDLQAHLEAENYAVGMVVLPACGIGAPHIRQRQWIVAERLDNTQSPRLEGHAGHGNRGEEPGRQQAKADRSVAEAGSAGGLADTECNDRRSNESERQKQGRAAGQRDSEIDAGPASATNGFWRDPDWLFCRDGKWRPVESGTFPLVNGAPARVGRLRGYGNGIVAPLAQAFIETYMEVKT